MDIFVARQPVFTSDKKIFGYELLFRLGLDNVFPNIDGSVATSGV
ncbi:MAG TPA: signal transduction protein, partial [Desulfobacter sp.]|nr:signal transduction protein [Desulfobacter sp.]